MGFYKNTNSGITPIVNKLNDEISTLYSQRQFFFSRNNGDQIYCELEYHYHDPKSEDLVKSLNNIIKTYCDIGGFGIDEFYMVNFNLIRIKFCDENSLDTFQDIVFSKVLK